MDLKIDADALNHAGVAFVSVVQNTLSTKGCDSRILATAHARKAQSEE
jgi:hypothetical protein